MDKNSSGIVAVLARAEKDLLQLLSEAATRGDYRGIDAARAAAQGVRTIASSIEKGTSRNSTDSKQRGRRGSRRSRSAANRRSGDAPDYPRFSIKNDRLYKIGWSKKRRREYVHKLPKSVFDRVTQAMVSLQASGSGPHAGQEIIERAKSLGSIPLPDYQVYVVLAWLKATDLVHQIGRDGYTFDSSLPEQVQSQWEALAIQAA